MRLAYPTGVARMSQVRSGVRVSGRGPSLRRFPRSTYRSTNLRELERADTIADRLNRPHLRQQTGISPYRTQEVAGSSLASSIDEPADAGFVPPSPLTGR
jgi:hypothetical protein